VENSLRARIAALAQAEPALADDLAVRGALIEIVDHAEVGQIELRLPADLARARLAAGAPLLDRLDLPISSSTAALFERLAVAMLADPAARQPAETVLAASRSHRLHPEQVVGEAIVGHADHLATLAEAVSAPSELVASLADLAGRPLLAELAGRLRPAVALGSWDRGYCPVCGARPIFGERAEAGPRLRCGRCTTSWVWSLLRCPDCPTGRLTVLDTLDSETIGRWDLAGCDGCPSYLKVAAAPRSDRLADLLMDDLATWRLDRMALERGLTRQTGPGCRLEHGEPGGEEPDDD
jgi:formate dehydrogenase maturation protein FdhE